MIKLLKKATIKLQNINTKKFNDHNAMEKIKNNLNKYRENFISKLRIMILDNNSEKLEYKIFHFFIYFFTLLNFIFLCNISYDMSKNYASTLFTVNIICSTFFGIELIFKLIVLKKQFFSDCFNILDFIVVFSGIIEIIYVNVNSNSEGIINYYIKIIFILNF